MGVAREAPRLRRAFRASPDEIGPSVSLHADDEAWHANCEPFSSMRPIQARRRVAIVLAAAAGGVDAVGYITLFKLFTAHMTGNTDRMAVAIGQHVWRDSIRHFAPIPFFVAGVIAGAFASAVAERHGARATRVAPMLLEAGMLAVFWAVASRAPLGSPHHPTAAYYGVVAFPSFAMGMQTSSYRRIADHSIRTTFITGMLAVLGEQLVAWWSLRRQRIDGASDRTQRERSAAARVRVSAAIWGAYVVGAVSCTLLQHVAHFAALALPIAAIVGCSVVEWRAANAPPGSSFAPSEA